MLSVLPRVDSGQQTPSLEKYGDQTEIELKSTQPIQTNQIDRQADSRDALQARTST